MANSNRTDCSRKQIKPSKPYKEFPLFPHATKRWAKKSLGKLHYFGPWSDPNAALKNYLDQKDDLYAGRVPRSKRPHGATVRDAANQFLAYKRRLLDTSELSPRSFQDYYATCQRLIDEFGRDWLLDDLSTGDFERFRAALANFLGPVALGNQIQRVRSIFKHAYETELLNQPVRFGPGFKRPSKKTLRLTRAANGERMLEADQLQKVINAAVVPLKAMVLLALNCGFGNSDISLLPLTALDLKKGWVTFPRPKTGIPRRCPLWSQTVTAIRDALLERPQPTDGKDAGIVFITRYGNRWVKAGIGDKPDAVKIKVDDAISKEFSKLLRGLGLKRKGLSFYSIRHVFRTIADESLDQPAVDFIMGHADLSMASIYRQRIADSRLKAVVDHVHTWLFGAAAVK